MRRLKALAQETPRFCVWPTDDKIRGAGTHLRHLNTCASGRKPWSTANTGSAPGLKTVEAPATGPAAITGPRLRHGKRKKMWDAQLTRKPTLLLRLFGWLLLRLAARALLRLLFQEPPRNTRAYFTGSPADLSRPLENTIKRLFSPKKFRALRALFAADAAFSGQRFMRWGTHNSLENPQR